MTQLPPAYLTDPPRIHADTSEGRAAMGYLHGNCGHCHNPDGHAGFTGQYLRHVSSATQQSDEPAFATTVNQLTSGFEIPGQDKTTRSSRRSGGQRRRLSDVAHR